jgi:hypothetical protein
MAVVTCIAALELPINEEVLLPLSKAFLRPNNTLAPRRKDEVSTAAMLTCGRGCRVGCVAGSRIKGPTVRMLITMPVAATPVCSCLASRCTSAEWTPLQRHRYLCGTSQ